MTEIPPSKRARTKALIDIAAMDAARPLDALLPELTLPAVPRQPVHPRLLETRAGGGFEWVVLVWEDPGGPMKLHNALRVLFEAAFLAELSKPPARVHERPDRKITGLRLVSLTALPFDPDPAIRAFGLRPAQGHLLGPTSERVIEAEAERSGRGGAVHAPVAAWTAPVISPPGALGEKLDEIQRLMASRMGDDVWGRTPGGPSRLFAMYAEQLFRERIQPNRAGLDTVELLLIQQTPDVVRWLPPLVFQALCDFIPVVANAAYGAQIAWAECEEVGEGFAQPPLFRMDRASGAVHVPIGQQVLQWWMMPIAAGEQVPSIAAWLEDQLSA